MEYFLRLIAAEPDISSRPIMIDSSIWEVIETGLKSIQGKPIVNSISLKNGEEEFLSHAKIVKDFGAAALLIFNPEDNFSIELPAKAVFLVALFNAVIAFKLVLILICLLSLVFLI